MPKKTKKIKRLKKRSLKRRKTNKNKRFRKNKNALARGPNDSDIVKCCMCEKEISKSQGNMPVKCFTKYGANRAHRICQDCWWRKFAKEGVNHACPGCVKHLPLNGPPIDTSVVIDLTEDD